MLDLETLGKKPGCKILTISACAFSVEEVKPVSNFFDIALRTDTQRLTVDQDTVDWWAKQSVLAQAAAFSNVKAVSIGIALRYFSDWLADLSEHESTVPVIWSKGASFDAPILAAAYEVYGLDLPWDFRDERCYRTLESEFKHLVTPPEFVGTQHTSLADAIYQAKYAQSIYSTINDMWYGPRGAPDER